MKRTITTGLLFIALISAGLAQDTTLTWVSQNGNPVLRESAAFLRKVWQEEVGLWEVRQYFAEGGLQMKGSYSNPIRRTKEGVFSFYDRNGTRVAQGSYDDDIAVGRWTFWFDDGSLMEEGKYLREITEAERDSIMEATAMYSARPKHWESVKDSTWVYYHRNGGRSGLVEYEDGKVIQANYWNEDGSETAPGAEVNREASFPGGIDALMHHLGRNIRYPQKARNKGYQGTTIVSFVVDEHGRPSDFAVVQTVHPDLDKEAIRVLKTMPPWEPAMSHNRKVDALHRLPVRYRLR